MKVFICSHCRNPLYFENSVCLKCGHAVGFDSATLSMASLDPGKVNQEYVDIANRKKTYRYCKNAEYSVCNWLVPVTDPSPYCTACRLNRTIPDLSKESNDRKWKNLEIAKHRLVYSLLRMALPLSIQRPNEPQEAIVFDFMEDAPTGEKVLTGHDNGIITINISEADEAERVRHKLDLGERYRTLLGHFRHEVGHYYWDVLLKDGPSLGAFREIFGDEQRDYGEALKTYYQAGAPSDWGNNYISPYATSHPWEDWAETWAHYLHLMDTLETAWSFGVRVKPEMNQTDLNTMPGVKKDPYTNSDFGSIIKLWYPLCFAVNSLNRSMGYADFYPFVIPTPVINKLQFIHDLVLGKRLRSKV